MTPAIILLTLCNLALWWRQHRRAQANHAEVWQAIARVKMQVDAVKSAMVAALSDIQIKFDEVDEKLAELDLDQLVTVVRPPNCNCVNCRKRRQLETN